MTTTPKGTPEDWALHTTWPWHTGRETGRTVHVQLGYELADTDPLIGVMDTPALAELVVTVVNQSRGLT